MTTFKVGDKVISPRHGKGKVTNDMGSNYTFPLIVDFKKGIMRYYTRDGRDIFDQLTLCPPKKAKPEPRPFAVGDVVWVKGTVSRFNETRVEVCVDGSYEYWTWKGSVKHAEEL